LQLFLDACEVYGIPLNLRGDHGTENLLVAAWMNEFRDAQGYIWGRLVLLKKSCSEKPCSEILKK
jgi:hypothetical protein